MDLILNKLKCDQCSNTLCRPVKLPCEKIICQCHTKKGETQFECKLCNTVHLVPSTGFPLESRLNSVLVSWYKFDANSKNANNSKIIRTSLPRIF